MNDLEKVFIEQVYKIKEETLMDIINVLNKKIEKIKEICQTYDKNGVYYNLTEDIMKVIEGAEDE